jgi:Protein kinase domain
VGSTGALQPALGSRYRILGEAVGQGAGAEVYRAHDDLAGCDVALKRLLLTGNAGEDSEAVALFQREYYTLAQLRHPNIIRVHDYGIEAGAPFYTMELLDGPELQDAVPMDPQRASGVLRDVASALCLLHARRLVHRDVSARNVRCASDGTTKLLDFGTMVPMGLPQDASGTPPFMSPEALRGEALDGRADLFALGALGYFLLIGRHAYPAKHLSDLRETWRSRPAPPKLLRAEIPQPLSDLVMALLQMERSRRPGHAHEVAARLTSLAGLPHEDHTALQSAHMAVPKLVGRERLLLGVRKRALRVTRGQGAALMIEGDAGLGRSRMLDACALEGQIVGAIPLRADAAHGRRDDYALARALVRELLQLAPEYALESAMPFGNVLGHLSTDLHRRLGSPALLEFSSRYEERPAMQRALRSFFVAVSDRRPLFISIDNVHRGDEPSVSVLALLARLVHDHRILITASAPPTAHDDALPALALLRESCEVVRLAPLRDAETRALLESILGADPRVATLAEQLHRVSEGNPGACLTLLQHLMNKGSLRHDSGGWVIPERLDLDALPHNVADACREQVATLSTDALELAQALSLCDGHVGLHDYLQLVEHGDATRLYAALDELQTRDVLVGSGRGYGFKHVGVASAVKDTLTAGLRRHHELRLSHVLQARGGNPIVVAHHLLCAGQDAAASACLVGFVRQTEQQPLLIEPTALPYVQATFDAVIAHCKQTGGFTTDVLLLETALVGLSMFVDPALAAQHATSVEDALHVATGLVHWPSTDASLDPLARIGECLTRAQQDWEQKPQAERELPPLAALQILGRYALYAMAPLTTMLDATGLDRVRKLIEPFVPVAPVLSLIHDVAGASYDICLALDKRAEERFLRVLTRVEAADGGGLPPFIRTHFRLAILYALCLSRAFCNDPRMPAWIAELDADPLQQPNAWRMRRHAFLIAGDLARAQKCGQRLEALMLENSGVRTLDGGTAYADLRIAVLSTDLGELKRALTAISTLAKRYPQYVSLEACAMGVYEIACGDLTAARRSLERGLADMRPSTHVAWATATDDYLWLRYETEGAELVAPLVEQALEDAGDVPLDLRMTSYLEGLLALCEADLGEHERAVTRMNAVLEACHAYGLAPLQMGNLYLRGARVGVVARDNALFHECARRYGLLCKQSGLPGLLARHDALMQLARGTETTTTPELDDMVGPSTQRLGGRRVRIELRRQLAAATDPRDRPARLLRWLASRAQASGGLLYAAGEDGVRCVAATGALTPEPSIDAAVQARLNMLQGDVEAVTERAPKGLEHALARQPWFIDAVEQRVDGEARITALVVLAIPEGAQVPADLLHAMAMEIDPEELLNAQVDARTAARPA